MKSRTLVGASKRQLQFTRAILSECEIMRPKVASCRAAWDKKSFQDLKDSLETFRQLHDQWVAAFLCFRGLVTAPYDDPTPMERIRYQSDYVKWLSSELDAWQALLPAIRRFARRKDPRSILRVQKLLRSITDLRAALDELVKTANPPLDLQMIDYLHYHPPKIVRKA